MKRVTLGEPEHQSLPLNQQGFFYVILGLHFAERIYRQAVCRAQFGCAEAAAGAQ
jgi:hypothetical protein